MKVNDFLILGYEKRQSILAELLKKEGHRVVQSEDYINGNYDAILLPVPSSIIYLKKCTKYLNTVKYVFGCNIKNQLEMIQDEGPRFIEYMESDNVAYKNAIATAEGAIAEAICLSDINLHKSEVLLAGYGRCGEILASKLRGFGCNVTVMDRKPEKRARALANGYDTVAFTAADLKTHGIEKYRFLFNTVPRPVFNSTLLSCFSQEICILDIASKPGGTDFEYCEKHAIKAKLLPGLPGKYAPRTSANILLDVIHQNMDLVEG